MAEPQYSIVIPLYNEESRIPKSIDEIFEYFRNRPETFEFIFVNDGSKDKTLQVLNSYKGKYDFKVVSYDSNRGKGYAVKQGALASVGSWVIFFDIDLATPLGEFAAVASRIGDGNQIFIGSRRLESSKINVCESKTRVFLGRCFTGLSNFLVPGITDFTCGFKCFSREAVNKIFPLLRIERWVFDTEVLYIAKLKKIPVEEVAVNWAHNNDSRVRVGKAVVSSIFELFEIVANRLRGFYA